MKEIVEAKEINEPFIVSKDKINEFLNQSKDNKIYNQIYKVKNKLNIEFNVDLPKVLSKRINNK